MGPLVTTVLPLLLWSCLSGELLMVEAKSLPQETLISPWHKLEGSTENPLSTAAGATGAAAADATTATSAQVNDLNGSHAPVLLAAENPAQQVHDSHGTTSAISDQEQQYPDHSDTSPESTTTTTLTPTESVSPTAPTSGIDTTTTPIERVGTLDRDDSHNHHQQQHQKQQQQHHQQQQHQGQQHQHQGQQHQHQGQQHQPKEHQQQQNTSGTHKLPLVESSGDAPPLCAAQLCSPESRLVVHLEPAGNDTGFVSRALGLPVHFDCALYAHGRRVPISAAWRTPNGTELPGAAFSIASVRIADSGAYVCYVRSARGCCPRAASLSARVELRVYELSETAGILLMLSVLASIVVLVGVFCYSQKKKRYQSWLKHEIIAASTSSSDSTPHSSLRRDLNMNSKKYLLTS